jgi:Fic family protein
VAFRLCCTATDPAAGQSEFGSRYPGKEEGGIIRRAEQVSHLDTNGDPKALDNDSLQYPPAERLHVVGFLGVGVGPTQGRDFNRVGTWPDDRSGLMQVVSGPFGRERVHFAAPPAERVAAEMDAFLVWFNAPLATDPVIKAALAHLWFVTIHPFENGNGRIVRAIADLELARPEASPQRFYSMSAQIRIERSAYYDELERFQKGATDVTHWLTWFLACLGRAIHGADGVLAAVIAKAQFWERAGPAALNERQIKILNRLLDGLNG